MSGELALMDGAISVEKMLQQRKLIEEIMGKAMKEGHHYGIIPGCKKPTLMQPGAQTLCNMFQLFPDYKVTRIDLNEGRHREYEITCRMVHRRPTKDDSGKASVLEFEVAQGVGNCSSRESKYRFRNEAKEVIFTEHEVPRTYWNLKKSGQETDRERAESQLRTILDGEHEGLTIGTKKGEDGVWRIVAFAGGEGKVENENIEDTFNTILKMAKKRAYVDATITALACNDLFTSDMEDIQENQRAYAEQAQAAKQPDAGKGSNAQEKTRKPESGVKGWRDVVVHFGKIKGKKLVELDDETAAGVLKWLKDTKATAGRNWSKANDLLIAALEMRHAELSAKAGATPIDEIPMDVNLEEFLTEKKVNIGAFMALALEKGWTEADRVSDVDQAHALQIIKNWEEIEKNYPEDIR